MLCFKIAGDSYISKTRCHYKANPLPAIICETFWFAIFINDKVFLYCWKTIYQKE